MRLGDLVAALAAAGTLERAPEAEVAIGDVTDDSRRVVPGSLFCAVEGTTSDGHRFVADAVRGGAVAAVVRRPLDVGVPQVVVRDTRAAVAVVARAWHGGAAGGLRLVAVTGTNGKTTTVALLRHILGEGGRAGSIGTLGAVHGRNESLDGFDSLTTPGALDLHRALAELARRGCTTVVMEASSHALDQGRLLGLEFAAAVFTNLTQDHLDYHPTMDAYRAAKLGLVRQIARGGWLVVNADDEAWAGIAAPAGAHLVHFGRAESAEVVIRRTTLRDRGADAVFRFGTRDQAVTLPLLGEFNVMNAAGAAAAAWRLGESPEAIAARLADAPQVLGRMEQISAGHHVILRDYAHTPDALERALAALRPIARGRLIVVFGAGGDRDRRKRPLMGAAVARGAHVPIVTSDNPRTEDPDRIIDEIEAGMGETPRIRITDRRAAIHRAVAMLQPGDCLLLAGKGHETYQVIGTERVPFDEREVVAEALAARTAR
jgi:UDP-N-acetylmuramoyl-L-alanyl-D-glutamate--2,6-diaminopimelate ligase